jgi:hypothetical protein
LAKSWINIFFYDTKFAAMECYMENKKRAQFAILAALLSVMAASCVSTGGKSAASDWYSDTYTDPRLLNTNSRIPRDNDSSYIPPAPSIGVCSPSDLANFTCE